MSRLAVGLISFSLMCGSSAFAQLNSSAATSNFPSARYLPLPPHFQPRRADTIAVVSVAPPPLPSYAQPPIPGDGYLWMPGFWAWREEVPDYYWVPGTWVKPPPGLLWTPAYWSRIASGYAFQAGYWAADVGFYGGIDYGFGYPGDGYQGGRWQNGAFFYNRAANNLGSVNVARAYDQTIPAEGKATQSSFNGGRRGTKAKPTSQQKQLALGRHFAPSPEQQEHFEMAAKDRSLYSKLNRGEPGVAATSRAGELSGAGITQSSAVSDDTNLPNDTATTGVNPR